MNVSLTLSFRVFANADSLFYYAREARLGNRPLSTEEIQALLNKAREPAAGNVTLTAVPTGRESRSRETDKEVQVKGRRKDNLMAHVEEDKAIHDDCRNFAKGTNDTALGSIIHSDTVGEWTSSHGSSGDRTHTTSELLMHKTGEGEKKDRKVSVESWMLDREEDEEESEVRHELY